MADPAILGLVRAYDPGFRRLMTASPEQVADAASCLERARALPRPARDLLDTLLLAQGAGVPLTARHRARVEAEGEALWLGGFLLPVDEPSRGATIDPRHYAAAARVNPGLRRRHPFRPDLPRPEGEPAASFPPADARWDALVVAAALEARPLPLNKDGQPRRDHTRRLLDGLGPDAPRWDLALEVARATGLARPAGALLPGYPEARPRALVDPLQVLEPALREAAQVLLRVVDEGWVAFDALLELLQERARDVLFDPTPRGVYAAQPGQRFDAGGWARTEAPALRQAAERLHRVGALDAALGPGGVSALRRPQPRPQLPPGLLLTPDLDLLVAVGELGPADHGRLCRLAPYVEGDRVFRHRLTREGVAADLAAGHDDAEAFLARLSRTGMPLPVRQALEHWARAAARLTLFTGVTLIEDERGLRRAGPEDARSSIREINYTDFTPGRFLAQGDVLTVPLGEDALTVRSALARVATLEAVDEAGWRYRLSPRPVQEVEGLLETLRRHHPEPELPGALEVAVLAASGLPPGRVEEAVVLHLPARAAPALRRDPVAGPLLARTLGPAQCVVDRADLPALGRRLAALGVEIEGLPR